MRNTQLIEAILKLSIYKFPSEIAGRYNIPYAYRFNIKPLLVAQPFAVSGLLWQAQGLLGMLACFNPSTVGQAVWNNIPSIKQMLEMLVTKSWRFPPFVPVGQSESSALVCFLSLSLFVTLKTIASLLIILFRLKKCNCK